MIQHNPTNERIKYKYFTMMAHARGRSPKTIDMIAKALARFEEHTHFRDFGSFRLDHAIDFKTSLAQQISQTTGQPMSKATLFSTIQALRGFFSWLAQQPGYRSKLDPDDAEYFHVSLKDARVATARRQRPAPTLKQIRQTLAAMPCSDVMGQRNRALMAFIILTGARDGAAASMKLKHIDLHRRLVFQDARDVKTKFSKTFTSFFFPVGAEIEEIVRDWVVLLRDQLAFGDNDPVFPSTLVIQDEHHQFHAAGLSRIHWKSGAQVRTIFAEAFRLAGLPYFNPHSFRTTLGVLGQELCRTEEEYKAFSLNLGHESVQTTRLSYSPIDTTRQGQIILGLKNSNPPGQATEADGLEDLFARMRQEGYRLVKG